MHSKLWRLERSRTSGAPLRKSCALHRIRDTGQRVQVNGEAGRGFGADIAGPRRLVCAAA